MNSKGSLSVLLVVTRYAKEKGLPIKTKDLLTEGGGQVVGLGKAAVQSILKDYGIDRVLAEEGGRTSRGSVGNMKKYVEFLNDLKLKEKFELDLIERWCIGKVKAFLSGKPLILRFDNSKSLRSIVHDLLLQAKKRQEQSSGTAYLGAILQHLVGAKLQILLKRKMKNHGSFVSDESTERNADFSIEDVTIHVTTSPSEALVRKCKENIDKNFKPIIITINKGVDIAEGLCEQSNIKDRVDVFEAEQFIAGNLYELGKFALEGRHLTANQLIESYNEIIDECETDPGLRIEISQ